MALGRFARKVVRSLLWFYRAGLSPLLGPSCRYHPSCSHYAEEALVRFGFGRGLLLAGWRILRCHPFSRGGLDEVPARPGSGRGQGRSGQGEHA